MREDRVIDYCIDPFHGVGLVAARRPRPPTDLSTVADGQYLRPRDAARYLGVAERTLESWRRKKEGPPYYRPCANTVTYKLADLIAWAEARRA